ncbi:hypothetical protein ACWDA7_49460 [Streptomyces sp. NPDC001156]
MARRRVIVYPPSETGGRRVRVDGVILETAYSLQDLSMFLCRAGARGAPTLRTLDGRGSPVGGIAVRGRLG